MDISYGYITLCLPIHQLMDMRVFSIFWPLCIILLQISYTLHTDESFQFLCKFLGQIYWVWETNFWSKCQIIFQSSFSISKFTPAMYDVPTASHHCQHLLMSIL